MSVSLQAPDSAIQLAEQVQAKNVPRIHLGLHFDTATSNAVFCGRCSQYSSRYPGHFPTSPDLEEAEVRSMHRFQAAASR